jgi:macrolide transport system ATP-binding/permease protein
VNTTFRDLRYAARRLRKAPGFTLVALLSLALGVGANTATFSLVNAVLLRRPPLAQPERLVEIHLASDDFPFTPFSYPDYEDLQRASGQVFAGIAASQLTPVPHDLGGRVESVLAELVNGSYFRLLGLHPALGRLLGPEDHVARGGHPVAVLAYDFWKSTFGGDPGVIGREIRVAGRPYTIVGVAPREYAGNLRGLAPSLYLPILMLNQLQPSSSELDERFNHAVFLTGRLRDGATLAQAQTVVAGFGAAMRRAEPEAWAGRMRVVLTPVSDIYVSPSIDGIIGSAAGLLLAVVGLVLLIACANLASFLLAQARTRRREIAIRLALGARRRVLVRQLLTESMLLALLGGTAGVAVASVLLHLVTRADLPLPIPITLDLSLDPVVLGFALAVSIAAGVLFGLVPALQSTRSEVMESIKTEAVVGAPGRHGRARITPRGALVVAQVAVSFVLLVTTGLFLRSFRERATVDPGFGHDPAVVVTFGLQGDRYTQAEGRLLVRRLEEHLAATPEISAVGVASNIHLNPLSTSNLAVNVEGFTPPEGQLGFSVDVARVDQGFFEAMGIPLLHGRGFGPQDVSDGPPVAIVNEAMAQRFWPDRDPVGQVFRADGRELTVVGVARTAKIRTLEEEPRPFVYRPFSQDYSSLLWLVARTRGDADRALPEVLTQLRALDPDLMILQAKTLARHLATMLLPARLGALTFTLFSALALTLATIGVYGIVAYALRSRTREIGIRLSLGAEPSAAVRLIMGSGLRLVVGGVLIGLGLSAAGARLLGSFLFGVSAYDPVTFVAVPVVLVAVGALAAYLPARRATRVDPTVALKAE